MTLQSCQETELRSTKKDLQAQQVFLATIKSTA